MTASFFLIVPPFDSSYLGQLKSAVKETKNNRHYNKMQRYPDGNYIPTPNYHIYQKRGYYF
jgi:hypothetical protein